MHARFLLPRPGCPGLQACLVYTHMPNISPPTAHLSPPYKHTLHCWLALPFINTKLCICSDFDLYSSQPVPSLVCVSSPQCVSAPPLTPIVV